MNYDKSNRWLCGLFAGVWLAMGVVVAVAQEVPSPAGDWELKWLIENDGGILKRNRRTDRHYTSGIQWMVYQEPRYGWQEGLLGAVYPDASEPEVRTAVGYSLGQQIFTPDFIDRPDLRAEDDMTFAGWLYGSLALQRRREQVMDHLELRLGVIGPSALGEQSQSSLHHAFDLSEPDWGNQLSDEPAVDLTYLRGWRCGSVRLFDDVHADVVLSGQASVGSVHNRAGASVMLRMGWRLPDDFGPARIDHPEAAAALHPDYPRLEADRIHGYVFTRATGSAVTTNRFLTGLTHEPIVGDLEIGAVVVYRRIELAYSQTFQTRAFEEQDGHDEYASVSISWRF